MAEYFSHDYNARNDPKLVHLQMEMGQEGKGVFWDLVEILYEQGGYIMHSKINSIAFALHVDCKVVTDVLTKYDLFKNDGERYWSNSVLSRINTRIEIKEKRKIAASKRWIDKGLDANAMQMHTKSNAIKEKEKEIKEKESKVNIKKKDNENNADAFYLSQISENEGKEMIEGYKALYQFLSDNKANHVFKIENQLTYAEYENLKISEAKTGISLGDKVKSLVNDKRYAKDKKSVYLTLNNWMNRDAKR